MTVQRARLIGEYYLKDHLEIMILFLDITSLCALLGREGTGSKTELAWLGEEYTNQVAHWARAYSGFCSMQLQ